MTRSAGVAALTSCAKGGSSTSCTDTLMLVPAHWQQQQQHKGITDPSNDLKT
jgi:hypothetical protein